MARLKAYAADIDGLHEWVVAAPNQRAALEAFGVNQNLFAQGRARVADEPAATEAALKAPGTPLRRLAGTKDPFKPVDSGGQGAWEKAAKALPQKARKRAPSRARLDRAEAALEAFEAKAGGEAERLAAERAALEARARKLEAAHLKARQRRRSAIEAARKAYKAAGGVD